MNKAIFFDRDDTLIFDVGYPHKVEDLKFLDGVLDSLRELAKTDFKILIISNQSGINRGFFDEPQYHVFTDTMLEAIRHNGGKIDKAYFCPHRPDENCKCRKPETGMLDEAKKDFDINLEQSFLVGDRATDILAGTAAGCKTILIDSGRIGDQSKECNPNYVVKGLPEVVSIVKGDQHKAL